MAESFCIVIPTKFQAYQQHKAHPLPSIASASRSFRTISSGACRFRRFPLIQGLLAHSGLKTFIPLGSAFQQQASRDGL
jgi:hypothetical protein